MRGNPSKDGDTRISQNGYLYVRTPQGKWELAHRILAETEVLGRPLEPNERVYFIDGDRANLDIDNIGVREVNSNKSKEARRARLQARIDELQAQLEELE